MRQLELGLGPARLLRPGPALAALATFALHAACWDRYGIFRDELYYLRCGQRLSLGYVDQPPGIAVVARLAGALFGTWVPGVRLLGWAATAATVYLAGRLAARLLPGDDRRAAAAVAAVATACCLVLRWTGHLLTMNAFEPLLVVAAAEVLVRLAQGEDPRLWVAAGGLLGLAVLFKYGSASLSLALALGILVTPARRALRTPWALVGAAVGLLLVLPNLAWQAAHGFPFLELVRNGVLYKNAQLSPLELLGAVLLEGNPLDAPLWLGGLLWLLVARRARPARFLGVAALAQLAALALGHGKPYYVAPLLPVLLGAGGAALVAVVRPAAVRRAWCGALIASLAIGCPFAVPILPVEAFLAYQSRFALPFTTTERLAQSDLPQIYADQLGWPELAAGVARVYRSLPPGEQARAAVFAPNYGVAAAVDVLGPALGLPPGLGVSGHNQYWLWGLPPGRGDPMIVVSGRDEDCGHGFFRERQLGEVLAPVPHALPNDDGHTLWICRGARVRLDTLPGPLRHYE